MTGKSFAVGTGIFLCGFASGVIFRYYIGKIGEKNKEQDEEEYDEEKEYHKIIKTYDTVTFSDPAMEERVKYTPNEKLAIEEVESRYAEAESPEEDEYDSDDDDASEYPDPYDDYVDYKPTNPYGNDPEDYEEEGRSKMHKKNVWPYEIDQEEYDNDKSYTKSTLEYYKNNVLIDEDGSKISNAGSIIGNGVLKNLLVSGGAAYIRNENLEIDYEIIFINENYESYDEDYD